MARVTGLEPATSGVTGRRSNQLSYTRIFAVTAHYKRQRRLSTHRLQRPAILPHRMHKQVKLLTP